MQYEAFAVQSRCYLLHHRLSPLVSKSICVIINYAIENGPKSKLSSPLEYQKRASLLRRSRIWVNTGLVHL